MASFCFSSVIRLLFSAGMTPTELEGMVDGIYIVILILLSTMMCTMSTAKAACLTCRKSHGQYRLLLFVLRYAIAVQHRYDTKGWLCICNGECKHIVSCFRLSVDIHQIHTIQAIFLHGQQAMGTLLNVWRVS